MGRLITPIYALLCLVIIAALACLPNQSITAAAPVASPRYTEENLYRSDSAPRTLYRRFTDTKTGKCLIVITDSFSGAPAVVNDQTWCAQGE